LARPVKHDGGLYNRKGSKIWWMRYRDKDGARQREATLTEDWTEAQKCLRERLQARDNNTRPALRRGQDLNFGEWSDFYLENFSKPPFRASKTHEVVTRRDVLPRNSHGNSRPVFHIPASLICGTVKQLDGDGIGYSPS